MYRSILLILSLALAFQQPAGDRFHQAIRNNDLPALRSLIKEHGVNAPDSRQQTPLMLAAAFGSVESVQFLLDSGADVKAISAAGLNSLHLAVGDIRKVRLLVGKGADINVRSQMGRTPLLVAASTNGASETVKFLLSSGADMKTPDATGITPLLAAASVNDFTSAKLLMDRGVDVNAAAKIPASSTALLAAAHNGNAELVRLLLAKGADAKAVSDSTNARVTNGFIQFGAVTALHSAALSGNPEISKMLLAAGAPVNAVDVRGMTPLMWSVSTDRPNLRIVRMLLESGADTSIRSKANETILDWARKFNNPAILAELKLKPAAAAASPQTAASPQSKVASGSPRSAVERSLPILQETATGMLPKGGCIACHAQPVTHMATMLARDRGWTVNASFLTESAESISTRFLNADQPILQATEPGGQPDTMLYGAVALAAAKAPPSWNTDVLVHYLLAKQRAEGNWYRVGASRAPIQDGNLSRTALSIRVLTVYGIPARKTEIEARIKRASDWLAAQTPLTTEDRVMQLLGLHWANASVGVRETRKRELIAQQRPDGGWAQTLHLSSDAYATGQALYTLRELGVPSGDVALQRGVDFLVKTQRDDGTWYVPSRAMKIQPYFESGFPYGHDQWISAAATAWAAMGLSQAATEPRVAVAAPVR